MRAFQALIICRQNREEPLPFLIGVPVSIENARGFALMQFKHLSRGGRIRNVEAVGGELLLFGKAHFSVAAVTRPPKIEDVIDVLEIGGDTVQTIGQLDRDGIQVDCAALLKIGELGDLQSIQQNLPANSPRSKRWRLPIVFLKTNIVFGKLDADGTKALEIQILYVCRRGLEYYLKLQMLVEAIGIFSVAAVGGPTTWLHIGHAIWVRPEDAEECFRVHGAGTHLDIVGLLKNAILIGPKFLKLKNQILKYWPLALFLFYFKFLFCPQDTGPGFSDSNRRVRSLRSTCCSIVSSMLSLSSINAPVARESTTNLSSLSPSIRRASSSASCEITDCPEILQLPQRNPLPSEW